MTEIENERLRTRCAELAAEVERLQNVAEITNKELHRLQSVLTGKELQLLTLRPKLESCEAALADRDKELESVRAQLSAAKSVIDEANGQDPYRYIGNGKTLAYPNPVYENDAEWVPVYLRPIPAQQSPAVAVPDGLNELIAACRQIGFPVVSDGMKTVIDDMQSALRRVQKSVVQPSPRITEQDARDFAIAFLRAFNKTSGPSASEFFAYWVGLEEGRALLKKLNETHHGR